MEKGLLTDYKVLVLTVDEAVMAPKMQEQFAVEGELTLDDATRIIGCWNGLAKRAGTTVGGESFPADAPPMRRAVAFAKDIKESKKLAAMFPAVVEAYKELLRDAEVNGHPVADTNRALACEVHHVDGTFSALKRTEELNWLKAPLVDDDCRILINARCLSEGVDIPALDAVIFLQPRNSVVDVVQSVGRVMRKSPGKDYGYIILPVAVPADVSPAEAMGNNRRFRTVWQVLNALRSHDERFDAMINSIDLTSSADKKAGKGSDRLMGGHVGAPGAGGADGADGASGTDGSDGADGNGGASGNGDGGEQTKQYPLFSLSEWQEAIFARIVDKVGTRAYWEDWAADVADISARLIARIEAILAAADSALSAAFDAFHQGLKDNLNESITHADAVSMLAQHLITKPVFDALFSGHDFASHNPVSRVMQQMVDTLAASGLESETGALESFYASVRVRASEVGSAEGKQQVIAELYERFFKIGFAKQADALGIVYTPVEIVNFIVRAADQASRAAFGRGLTDRDVHILDGFTGTGTFMTRLLQSGLIRPEDLARKYASELHANEIMLLAYYIAAVNIETTYHALAGVEDYEPFPGICLADTFQISEDGDELDLRIFPANNERITRQLATQINIVMGNPPYSSGQNSANDLNANLKYQHLDARIAATYAKLSTATNKNSLYDSYLRAFRWATDRIGDQGVVAFVSNGGWIDGNTADGIRLSLANEFSRIFVFNLRGNQRTAGEISRKEGGKVFGGGSRNTIAIWIGVKNPAHTGPCELFYHDIGDYLSREQKLEIVSKATLASLDWTRVSPNSYGDWLNQRDEAFSTWPVLGEKKATEDTRIFSTFSRGLETTRDAWVYNFGQAELERNVGRLIANYNRATDAFADYAAENGISQRNEQAVNAFLTSCPDYAEETRIKWSRSLRGYAGKGLYATYDAEKIVKSAYRPYCAQHAYFDKLLNHERGQMPSMFPTPHHSNIGFYQVGNGSSVPFSVLMLNCLPDLHVTGAGSGGQYFPRWTYELAEAEEGTLNFGGGDGAEVDQWGYRRVDNITDEIVELYEKSLGGQVSKDDIFYFVYGQLHDPAYRGAYAADLKKMLPRICPPASRERFDQVAGVGRRLADLHLGYAGVRGCAGVDVILKNGVDPADRETWRVAKMRWKAKDNHSAIVYNPKVTIVGIPAAAERYMVGSRTALGWVLERYQVKTDKASGIVDDPNDWADEVGNPRYIVDLIAKVAQVAVETLEIVDGLTAGK